MGENGFCALSTRTSCYGLRSEFSGQSAWISGLLQATRRSGQRKRAARQAGRPFMLFRAFGRCSLEPVHELGMRAKERIRVGRPGANHRRIL